MRWLRWTLLLPISACAFISEDVEQWRLDPDGDGVNVEEDCDSDDASVGAATLWYMDLDGDGYGDPDNTTESCTQPENTSLVGTDCWDDPDNIPADFVALNELPQPAASEVYPGADNAPYDGVDQGCAGEVNEFDVDGDGYNSAWYADRSGAYGDDCVDGSDLDSDNFAGLAASSINPAASEVWYDGTDADCDGNDCDADGDGFDGGISSAYCDEIDCDDTDSEVRPDKSVDEIPYNGIDDNCDVSVGDGDGDADGDGYWASDYAKLVSDPLEIPKGYEGDCWDDPSAKPAAYIPINSGTQLTAEEVHPAATDEPYDDVDADCAGDSDFDADGDGYDYDGLADRNGSTGDDCFDATDQPTSFDNDASLSPGEVNPGALESYYDGTDANCDGNDDDADEDGYDYLTDCDESDASVNPGAIEVVGDEVDQDCDGTETCYADADDDGYRPDSGSTVASSDEDCSDAGEATRDEPTGDCYDTIATAYPKAAEVCDGVDSDCSGTSGTDDGMITVNDTTNVSTIQGGIDSAGAGGKVAVCEGDYTEALTISGDLTLTAPSGSAVTTIESDVSGPVVVVESGEVTIDGFTLKGGIGTDDPNGSTDLVGGGVAVLGTDTVTISSSSIEGNLADLGGGLYVASGGDVVLTATELTDNEAYSDGGGVYLDGATLTADARSSVFGNESDTSGGGVVLVSGASWSGGTISSNSSIDGAGLYVDGDASLSDATIESNSGSNGGGLLLVTGELETSGLTIESNTASYGGGMYLLEGVVTDDGTSLVTDNSAGFGGGFYSDETCELADLTVDDNAATYGGGGYVLSGTTTLDNATITTNTATLGGGVYLLGDDLVSTSTDWGSGTTDNSSHDVYVNGEGSFNYSGTSSFSCDTTNGCN